MRSAIRKALELAKRGVAKIVLELPTGYGKTSAAPLIYRAYREAGLCWKAIHVFPLRAVLHKTLKRYVKEHPDIQFAYQDGDVTLKGNGYVKDPWFTSEYVLTTYDSFVHNLFKVPVAEFRKAARSGKGIHYHWAIAEIYPSCVFLDEAHLTAEGAKQASAVAVAVEALADMEVPVVVFSATMGKWKHSVFKDFVFVQLGERDEEGDDLVIVKDEEFEGAMKETSYSTAVIDVDDVARIARRKVEVGKRVLVVVNDLKKVAALADELRDLKPVLIHSMLTRNDREKAEEALGDTWLVVGTGAIEAGVDVSFDVLISDVPSVESVVQRVGRVCRYGGRCRGELYFFGKGAEKLEGIRSWRLPYKDGSYVEYLSVELPGLHTAFLRRLVRSLWVEEISELVRKMGLSLFRDGLLVEAATPAAATTPCVDASGSFAADIAKLAELGYADTIDGERISGDPYKFALDYFDRKGELPVVLVDDYKTGAGPGRLWSA